MKSRSMQVALIVLFALAFSSCWPKKVFNYPQLIYIQQT